MVWLPAAGCLLAIPLWVGTLTAPTLETSLCFLFAEHEGHCQSGVLARPPPRAHPAAFGGFRLCPRHSWEEAQRFRSHREAVSLEPRPVKLIDFAASDEQVPRGRVLVRPGDRRAAEGRAARDAGPHSMVNVAVLVRAYWASTVSSDGLLRLRSKARGCSMHSGRGAWHLRPPQEAMAFQPHAAQVAISLRLTIQASRRARSPSSPLAGTSRPRCSAPSSRRSAPRASAPPTPPHPSRPINVLLPLPPPQRAHAPRVTSHPASPLASPPLSPRLTAHLTSPPLASPLLFLAQGQASGTPGTDLTTLLLWSVPFFYAASAATFVYAGQSDGLRPGAADAGKPE